MVFTKMFRKFITFNITFPTQ